MEMANTDTKRYEAIDAAARLAAGTRVNRIGRLKIHEGKASTYSFLFRASYAMLCYRWLKS